MVTTTDVKALLVDAQEEPHRERNAFLEGITFREFTRLAKRNGWTISDLAREFRGLFTERPDHDADAPSREPVVQVERETPREYFARVFKGKPSPRSLIVWAPVVEKYVRAKRYSAIGDHVRRCECAPDCEKPVWGRKKYYDATHRQRAKRARDLEHRLGLPRNGGIHPTKPEVFP